MSDCHDPAETDRPPDAPAPPPVPFAITITRQLGSGATFLGRQLAARLGILYLDRAILQEAARRLQVPEEVVEARDEAVTPLWITLMEFFASGSPAALYTPPPLTLPSDEEVQRVEAWIIAEVAQARNVVVIGRGGGHILRARARHLGVYVHAEPVFRRHRVEALYGLAEKEAQAALEQSDHERARFHHRLTGRDWNDAGQYDLCLDTGRLGVCGAVEVVLAAARARFGALSSPIAR